MSIYFYDKKCHAGGFVGYRVSVMVDGKHRQKYISCDPSDNKAVTTAYKVAQKIEQEWKQEQALYQGKNMTAFKERSNCSPLYSTGVAGIKMRILKDTLVPCFIVQVSHKGERYNKKFPFDRAYHEAWASACQYLTKIKEQPDAYSSLYKRMPVKEKFLVMYVNMIKDGRKVSAKGLPKEIDKKIILNLLDMELIPTSTGELRDWLISDYIEFKKGNSNAHKKCQSKRNKSNKKFERIPI